MVHNLYPLFSDCLICYKFTVLYSDGNELRFTSVNLLISLLLQKVRLPEFEEEFFPQHWHLIQIIPFGSCYLAAPLRFRLFKEDSLFTD